jgi:hypothetical protein
MHNHWLFIGNVLAHWVAFMSSIVSFTLGIVEYWRDRKTEGWVFAAVAFLFLLIACDSAWQDEHLNSQVLIAEKSLAVQGENFWKDQSYQKDASLRSRDQLLAQNYTALIGEQGTASKAQESLTELSGKILEIGKPLNLKWDSLALESPEKVSITPKPILRSRWLLLTNKPVNPAEFTFGCSMPIDSAEVKVVGSAGEVRVTRLDKDEWGAKVTSPAWSPDSPVLVITNFSQVGSGSDITCRFHLRSSAQ